MIIIPKNKFFDLTEERLTEINQEVQIKRLNERVRRNMSIQSILRSLENASTSIYTIDSPKIILSLLEITAIAERITLSLVYDKANMAFYKQFASYSEFKMWQTVTKNLENPNLVFSFIFAFNGVALYTESDYPYQQWRICYSQNQEVWNELCMKTFD